MKPMRDEKIFFDTNMIVYLHSDTDIHKRDKVRKAFIENERYISSQVLNEFSNVAFKKLHLKASEIDVIVEKLANASFVANIDKTTIHKAIALKDKYAYSYYDSLMIASALECGCSFLYSEDMSDNQIIEGLTIKNILSEKDI
jgi:predicted nucleic acid-binding protein